MVILCGLSLLLASLEDVRSFQVRVFRILEFAAVGLFLKYLEGGINPEEIIWGALPGGVLLSLALISKEDIGYGDAWMVLVLGILIGWSECAWILMTAVFWSFVTGVLLILFGKVNSGREIPFLPFLYLGWILQSRMI